MNRWTVPATVIRVVDGDTLILDLDLGWKIWRRGERCRLSGIDAPEIDTPEGQAAAAFVNSLVKPGDEVKFVSSRLDKYGRPLGVVILPNAEPLQDKILEAGHAKTMQ